MIEFICAVYNEEAEVSDLISHILPYVDKIHFIDDVSEDNTTNILQAWWEVFQDAEKFSESNHYIEFDWHQMEKHTGLCELVRIEALSMCEDDSWIIMLDADERFVDGDLQKIVDFCNNPTEGVTHIYFGQKEYIDGIQRAEFAKVKVFKKSAAHLPEIIHRDPQFNGDPTNIGGYVIHRKTKRKQVMREMQYLDTYDKLLSEGKVTEGDVNWFKSMHHYVRDRHG